MIGSWRVGRILAIRQVAVDEANALMDDLEAEVCDDETNPNPVTGNATGWHVGRILTQPRGAAADIPYLYSTEVLDELMGIQGFRHFNGSAGV